MQLDSALQASLAELRMANEQLRASRARIVATGDAERRKLERNLHDGAQQHLVALAVKLRLAKDAVEDDPPAAIEMMDELRTDIQDAIQELRALAHGIFPPLLVSGGLAEALPAAGGRAALPTTVDVSTGRHPAEIEAAVYFCCLESLQNAGKHAGDGATPGSGVGRRRDLHFEVSDDGAGFTMDATHGFGELGHGFVNMGDRLGAIDGSFAVESSPATAPRSTAPPCPPELPNVDVADRRGADPSDIESIAFSGSGVLRHSLIRMTPDQRLAAIAARQHGCATVEQALAAGLTLDQVYGRVRSGRFERLGHHVVRAAGAPATWEQQLMAGLLDLGGDAVVAPPRLLSTVSMASTPARSSSYSRATARHGRRLAGPHQPSAGAHRSSRDQRLPLYERIADHRPRGVSPDPRASSGPSTAPSETA